MLERRELGDAGLTSIRERLAWGRTLSRLLQDGLDLTAGRTWTYLPPAMPEEQAKRFAMGGVTRLATGRAPEVFEHPNGGRWERGYNLVEPLVAAEVGAFLTQHDHGVAVWEDPLLDAGDPWVRAHPEEPLLFLGEEVYVALSHATSSPAAVAAGLGARGPSGARPPSWLRYQSRRCTQFSPCTPPSPRSTCSRWSTTAAGSSSRPTTARALCSGAPGGRRRGRPRRRQLGE